MKRGPISLLLIEDSIDDAYLIQEMLEEVGQSSIGFEVTHVERLGSALKCLENGFFDVILLDLSLPDASGIETFVRLQQHSSTVPVVVLTGLDDDSVALDALHEGAQDYLVKAKVNPSLLARAVRYAIERKQAEVALARTIADMEQFAYMVSNDMQRSLRTIADQLQKLEQHLGERIGITSKTIIADAKAVSERVQALSDALLAYTRTSTWGSIKEPVDCQEILSQALETIRPAIEECNARVTADPLPTVMADTVQLLQLFRHLIINAIKFRSEERPEIHVSARYENGEWYFSVRDNGIGIDVGYLDRIFDPFQRIHEDDDLGVGIGLAICKRIIDRHEGRIWVESEPGQGSTFYFTLLNAAPT